MPNLVSYDSNIRRHYQYYFYGGSSAGMVKRLVVETTTLYKGTKGAVENALTAVTDVGHATECHKADGPWWEGTDTTTTYGPWIKVQVQSGS